MALHAEGGGPHAALHGVHAVSNQAAYENEKPGRDNRYHEQYMGCNEHVSINMATTK